MDKIIIFTVLLLITITGYQYLGKVSLIVFILSLILCNSFGQLDDFLPQEKPCDSEAPYTHAVIVSFLILLFSFFII